MPKVGQHWRLKRQPRKVATVTEVYLDDSMQGGYVRIYRPWNPTARNGFCLDTFLNRFERGQ